mgnify:CR=1 FL=1
MQRKLNWVTVPATRCSCDGLTVYTVPREYAVPRRRGSTVVQNHPVTLGRWFNSFNEPVDVQADILELFTAADFADYEKDQAGVNERIKELEAAGRILAVGHYTDAYSVKMTKDFDRWFYGFPFAVAGLIHDSEFRPITNEETLSLYQVEKGQSYTGMNHPELIIESYLTDYDSRNDDLEKVRTKAQTRAKELETAGILKKVGTVSRGGYDLLGGHALPYTVEFADTETEKDFFDRAVKRFHRIMDT